MKKHILLCIFSLLAGMAFSQSMIVKGTVTDKTTGDPLIGALITDQSKQNGSITDIDGNFSVKINGKSATLTISYMGYKTITVPVKDNKPMKIQLAEDTQALDEVVVIGYGTQKKETMVGSVSTIKSKELASVPASNLTHSIAGKTTGVSVVQSSGEIGRDEASIYIRGKATFSEENAKPLIVVDGIIRENFAQIDPNEIESMNILKDASATAVFGVKGANGVIIITTKRGTEGKPQVSLTAQLATNVPMRLYRPIDAYRTTLLRNEMSVNGNKQPDYTSNDLMNYRTKVSPYTHPDIDWLDEIMRPTSMQQQYNINIRGGTKSIRYFISGGFFNQDSPFKNDNITNFSRYNFRSNLDFDITKNLTASLNLGARIEDRHYPSSMQYNSWNIYHDAYAMSGRKYPAYNMDGSYAGDKQYQNIHSRIKDSGEFKENKNILELGLNVQYKMDWLLKGLSVRGQVAYDDNSSHGKIYSKQVASYEYKSDKNIYIQHGQDRPLAWDWEYVDNYRRIYMEAGINYARDFGKHNVSALLLFNRLSHGMNTNPMFASQGVVGRAVYGYDTRYLAEFNVGYNGSENFYSGQRYGLFPAFALGWIVSNEPFFKNAGIDRVMNNLKFRASLGWVGNDQVYAYDPIKASSNEARFIYLQQYDYIDKENSYPFGVGDNVEEGIRQGRIANPSVKWETSRKLNVGVETAFFNSKLTLNADYFDEYRSGILIGLTNVPDYVGTTFSPANIGIVSNKGFELEMAHNNYVNDDFSYFIKGNFSFVRNKVIEQGSSPGVLPYQRPEGFPIDTPLKFITLGYFQSYEEIENSPSQLGIDGNTEVRPGDLKYKDINGDGIIDKYDQIRTGFPTTPEIQYGLNLGLSYKGFDLSVLFQGSEHASFDKNWEIMWAFSNADNVYDKHWSYWTPEMGDGGSKYTELYGKYQNNEAGADYTLSSGSYLRLKNVDLGYTIPARITKKAHISNVRIYISALNLYTWAKEPYLDPDNRDNRGGKMPPVQSYNVGININF